MSYYYDGDIVTKEDIRTYECPKCKAQPGQDCIRKVKAKVIRQSRDGRVPNHRERMWKAQAKGSEELTPKQEFRLHPTK